MKYASQWKWFEKHTAWIAFLVAIHGLLLIADTLVSQLGLHHVPHRLPDIDIVIDIPLLLGLTLLYTSLYLRRRKRNAWMFATGLYIFLIGLNLNVVIASLRDGTWHSRLFSFLLPAAILVVLWIARRSFIVRSDMRTLTSSVRVAILVLVTTFFYGTTGFLLMDKRDFHQQISIFSAMHNTIDQFALTTAPLHPYTHRAQLFVDSLTFISISAVGLVLVSLFQPLRYRYSHHNDRIERARTLVYEYKADSEDFFKLWPHDKEYFFCEDDTSGIAYKTQNGVALVVGGPMGAASSAIRCVAQFEDLCWVNDWKPAFIHVTTEWCERLKVFNYQSQLIGKEAVVDVGHFNRELIESKYFRQIENRFTKLGFQTEMLSPPHHQAILERLRTVSDEWLKRPGRVERRFMMGYFSDQYLQQCSLFVARDAAGTIQGFINILPKLVPEEANYDMLRSAHTAPGNTNDYMLLHLLQHLHNEHVAQINLGLCPLVGIEDEPSTMINRTLRFVYSNGDRFYSFRGLRNFKAKYEPQWRARYVMYKGGLTDFTKTMHALTKAMKL